MKFPLHFKIDTCDDPAPFYLHFYGMYQSINNTQQTIDDKNSDILSANIRINSLKFLPSIAHIAVESIWIFERALVA